MASGKLYLNGEYLGMVKDIKLIDEAPRVALGDVLAADQLFLCPWCGAQLKAPSDEVRPSYIVFCQPRDTAGYVPEAPFTPPDAGHGLVFHLCCARGRDGAWRLGWQLKRVYRERL